MPSDRIVAEATGRIGNQLFVIAAGYVAARLSDRDLAVDLSSCGRTDARYPAEVLGFDWSFDDRISFGDFPRTGIGSRPFRGATRLQNALSTLTAGRVPATLRSRRAGHEPRLVDSARHARLVGFFQSAEHVSLACDLGLPRRLPARAPSDWLVDLEQRAEQEDPLVVVVRLGDYRALQHSHGLLGPEFFGRGLAALDPDRSRRIWLFCDELAAGLEYLPRHARERAWVVPQPADLPKEHILLAASRGRDHVIANSTFAWWAAWMSGDGSRVVAPRPWLRGRSVDGILPASWQGLDAGWPMPSP